MKNFTRFAFNTKSEEIFKISINAIMLVTNVVYEVIRISFKAILTEKSFIVAF